MEDSDYLNDVPVEQIGNLKGLSRKGKAPSLAKTSVARWNQTSDNTPWTQQLSDVVGPSDYGNSTYDEEITSIGQLNNLEDTRANIQPFVDKLGAGLGTFAGKTVTATAGGLGTLFYGIPMAIFNPNGKGDINDRISTIFDNDLNHALEKVNEGIDDTFKVYMSEAEQNGSLMDQTLGSAHFWTKSLLGDGLSFVAGAVLSANAISSLGKLASAANLLKKSSSAWSATTGLGALNKAVNAEKMIGGLKDFGSMATKFVVGAAYEGDVEANDFLKQSINTYKSQYAELNDGAEPSQNELDDYKRKILPTANALFAANVALVGGSNLATIPHIFGKGVKESIKMAQKEITRDVVGGVIKPILKDETLSSIQKGLRLAGVGLKPLASEGLMEEGGQNFAKNLALDYVSKRYNPDSAKNTYNLANSLGNAFNTAYLSVDGWKEIMAGMVIGGLGAPNVSALGHFKTGEDGKRRWNPLSLDPEKSLWTGGVVGAFQDNYRNKQRAKEIIDKYDQDIFSTSMKYMANNIKAKQGVSSQIGDIIHQDALAKEYDDSGWRGDFFTAKTAEFDKVFSSIKSRIDAGFYDTLELELIEPFVNMSNERFAENFGYKNLSDSELSDRKNSAIKQVKSTIKKTRDAINFVDSRLSFNTDTEEGRLRRDMMVYSLATSDNVKERIESVNELINNSINGRVDFGEKSSEIPSSVMEAKDFIKEVKAKFKSLDATPKELALKEDLFKALDDLPRLLRRKEEALELYATVKDPMAYNNFITSERILEVIAKNLNDGASLIADEQNTETSEAEEIIKAGGDQVDAAAKTGAEPSTVQAVINNRHKRKNAAKADSINKLLSAVNAGLSHDQKLGSPEDLLAELEDIIEDPNATDDEVGDANAMIDKINSLLAEDPDIDGGLKSDSKNGNVLNDSQVDEPVGNDDLDSNTETVKSINKELSKDDKLTDKTESGDMLIDAFDHIAWNNVKYEVDENGNFKYAGIDQNASKTLQDFRKISVGDKIRFEVRESDEFKKDNVGKVPVAIILNDEVIGWVHDVDYIRPDRVATKDNNLARNKEELIKLRETIIKSSQSDVESKKADIEKRRLEELNNKLTGKTVLVGNLINRAPTKGVIKEVKILTKGNRIGQLGFYAPEIGNDVFSNINRETELYSQVEQINAKYDAELASVKESRAKPFESQIEKVGNGRLITDREFGGDRRTNGPTTDRLPDEKLVITISDNGALNESALPSGAIVLNKQGITEGARNNIRNGIFAMIPVNKTNENGHQQIKYIAAPLSPKNLTGTQSKTITKMVESFIRSIVGDWNGAEISKDEFEVMANLINNKMSYKDTITDQKVSFNPSSLSGLKNFIKLFTYDRTSKSDSLNVSGESGNKKIFGINLMSNGSTVVSFGTPGAINSFKVQQEKDGSIKLYSKQAGVSAWSEADNDDFFETLSQGLEAHMNESIFYHNKALIRTNKIQVPSITANEDGKLALSFESKTYPQILKENTQTNLRSVDLGDGNHSYTVQRNIVFATPKVEKIEQPKVEERKVEVEKEPEVKQVKKPVVVGKIVIDKSNINISITDEGHQQAEGNTRQVGEFRDFVKLGKTAFHNKGDSIMVFPLGGARANNFTVQIDGELPIEFLNELYSEIKLKNPSRVYDIKSIITEFAKDYDIKSQPKEEFKVEPEIIEPPKSSPMSTEALFDIEIDLDGLPDDLMPSFENKQSDAGELNVETPLNNLGTDFINMSKSQDADIKRKLFLMNRNGEIKLNCK